MPQNIAIAQYTKVTPEIDGKVDKIWLKSNNQKGFFQREPNEGQIATNDTRFYALYDEKNIYLLFVMLDDAPQSIPARLVERDHRFYPDDSINFYLDTYNDNRTAFYYSTNPLGIKQDGLISENGENIDMSWDGIFEVDARINQYGWVAEFAIPFKTLRFNDEFKYQVWGFNVFRIRKKSREISYWSLVDQNFRRFRLDKDGVLIGMKNIKSGQNLSFLPYTTARGTQFPSAEDEYDSNLGLDLKYGVTSDLTLDLTLNPDFGQVEIDEEQINLDKRFEVQLEEKRPFFLENSTLFQTPFYQLFYSRRIGAQSDIKGGAKFTGKVGPYSIGALTTLTGGWENTGLGDPDKPPTDELFSVFRLQRDILSNSNIGAMYVDRQANWGGDSHLYNRAASVDWTVYSGQQYFIGQGVYSFNSNRDQNNDLINKEGGAVYGQVGHYGRTFWFDLSATYYEPDFNIDSTGFFQKLAGKGHKQVSLYTDMHPFVNGKIIRSWGMSVQPILLKDSDESQAAGGFRSRLWFETPDQSRIEFGYNLYNEVETDPFFSFFGRQKNSEFEYWGRDFYLEINTDPGKSVSVELRGNFDSQYYFQTHSFGYNQGLEASFQFKPLSNTYLEFGYKRRRFLDRDKNLLPDQIIGQSDVQIWAFRGRYLFTKTIFSRGFLQKTNAAESAFFDPTEGRVLYRVWDRVSANLLLGWRFKPGSTLYLAYTEEWDKVGNSFTSANRILFFKLSYYWSL